MKRLNIDISREVVLDLETLGVTPGCVVLSIGACTVDQRYTFYRAINIQDSLAQCFHKEAATEEWWKEQQIKNPKAAEAVISGPYTVREALGEFAYWYKELIGATAIWGNGSDFDRPILAAAYKLVGMEVPWSYRHARCFRTLKALYSDVETPTFAGIKHHALDDALNEAAHLQKIIQEVNNGY